jgi:hypothetical protein
MARRYHFRHKRLRIKKGDTDLDLILPNDMVVTLQFREEGNSVDVILPERSAVINWEGTDMKPAKAMKRRQHIRFADQLCIELPEKAFDRKEKG